MEIAGGKERAAANIANHLAQTYDLNIVTLDGSSHSFYTLHASVYQQHLSVLQFLGKTKHFRNMLLFWAGVKQLAKLIKKEKPDMLIGTDFLVNFMLLLAKVCFFLKTKLAAWEHMSFEDPILAGRPFLIRFRNFFYRFLDGVVVLTHYDETICKSLHIKAVCIPNAKPFSIEQKTDPLQKRILTIARLSPQKGLDLYVQIIQKLKDKLDGWQFILVVSEDTISLQELSSMIENAQVGSYISIKRAHPDVLPFYREASIYLMTSRYEGLPMVLIEAQECGLACISFDCKTGPSSIINDGKDGFLIAPFQVGEMADRLETLMQNTPLRKKMALCAPQSAARFDEGEIMSKWNSFIDQTLREKQ